MKQMWKKVMAIILVCGLLIGILPTQIAEVKAAETTTTFQYASIGVQDNFTRFVIYFDVSEAASTELSDRFWNNNTIYVDGVAKSGTGVNYGISGTKIVLYLTYDMVETGKTAYADIGTHTIFIPKGTMLGGSTGNLTTTNDVALKITGSTASATVLQAGTMKYNSGAAQGNRYLLWYDVDGATISSDIYWNNNTVYVDDIAKTGSGVNFTYDATNNRLGLCLTYEQIETGVTTVDGLTSDHTVRIDAGSVIGDLYVTNTSTVLLSGTTITAQVPQEVVTLTDRATSGATKGDGFYFVVDPADSYPYDSSWGTNIHFATGGIYIDGVFADDVFLKKLSSNLYYVCLLDVGKSVSANQVVTVNGTIKNSDVEVVFTEQSFVFTGSEWNVYEESEVPTEVDFDVTSIHDFGYNSVGNWVIYLNTATMPTTTVKATDGLSVEVNAGGTITNETAFNDYLQVLDNGGYHWTLVLPSGVFGIPAKDTLAEEDFCSITVKAGQFTDTNGTVYTLRDDIELLIGNTEVQGVVEHKHGALMERPTDNAGGVNGFYFITDDDNGFNADIDNWTARPNIECHNITVDGTRITTGVRSLVKLTDTLYYFALNESTNVPEIGMGSKTSLEFYASNEAEDGKLAYFPQATFVLNSDESWVIYKAGDANKDEEVNLKDLMRAKKFMADNTVTIADGNIESNGDRTIDDTDIKSLCELLLN